MPEVIVRTEEGVVEVLQDTVVQVEKVVDDIRYKDKGRRGGHQKSWKVHLRHKELDTKAQSLQSRYWMRTV